MQGQLSKDNRAELSLRTSPRPFWLRFYLRHTPTLANFKHLDDCCKRADNARYATPGTGSLSPDSRELPSLVADIEIQVTSVRGRGPRLGMSTNSPPGEPQFPVARVSNRFPPTNIQARGIPSCQAVPVWHRLLKILRASDYSPFVVELFPAVFLQTPIAVEQPVPCVTAQQVPTLAMLHRPPYGGCRPRRQDLHLLCLRRPAPWRVCQSRPCSKNVSDRMSGLLVRQPTAGVPFN